MRPSTSSQTGFTLIEMLLALAIAAMLMASLTGAVGRVLQVKADMQTRNIATREARFAMQRMVTAVQQSDRLLLPLPDNPNTNWREDLREQSNPPSPPEGDSTLATAVLAVTMGPVLDRDEDGWADANNDKDFLDLNGNSGRDPGEPERIDEDLGGDASNDDMPGIVGIDDNGDGTIDVSSASSPSKDDDEDNARGEDSRDGIDNDGDGAVDEDMRADASNDDEAGIAGIDDDFDLSVDEGHMEDDDEDGLVNEDWLDPIVFFLNGTTLTERLPNVNPASGVDFTEYPIADNVTHFRVERIGSASAVLVDLTLEITLPNGEPTSLNTRIRVGGGL